MQLEQDDTTRHYNCVRPYLTWGWCFLAGSFYEDVRNTSSLFMPSTSKTSAPTPISRLLLTHTMIYQMGNLSWSAYVRADRVESEMLKLIESAIENALIPVRGLMVQFKTTLTSYSARIDKLMARMEVR